MNPYLFQAALAFLLVVGTTVAVTKAVLELCNMPVMTDTEWAIKRATRPLTDEEHR